MQEWGWAIASVVVVITLVQLAVFYYLMRGDGDRSLWPSAEEGASASPPGADGDSEFDFDPDVDVEVDRRADAGGRRGGEDDDRRRCSQCGTPNERDPVFSYCRNCGAEL